MYCSSLTDCFDEIRAYADGEKTGYPLIVNTENYNDLQEILNRLQADESKQFVFASNHTLPNELPNIQEVLNVMSGTGCYIVVGISQSMMLQGEKRLDVLLDELLGLSIKGHAIVLVSHCRVYLETYRQRDIRLDHRIVFVEGEKSALPQIRLANSEEACAGTYYLNGVAALIARLEKITDRDVAKFPHITVVTSFPPAIFRSSMYAISVSDGLFDVLSEKYSELASGAHREYGTEDQWKWLLSAMKKQKSFSDFVASRFDATTGLPLHLGDTMESGDVHAKWLLWLALKVFESQSNRYLTFVLQNSMQYTDLEEHIYQDLLEIRCDDPDFKKMYDERKQLIARLPENLPLISSYCQLVGRHGKDAVFYLTDATENEEYAFMKLLDQYDWTKEELKNAIDHGFSELALYMQTFTFDVINTKLSEADSDYRALLTAYFERYKSQKVRNHIDADFLEDVNRLATERPLSFYKLPSRSTILKTMDRKNAQGYFIDALGVEYLSYIQAKCEQYGLVYEISIGHCELPSITGKNKDFLNYFTTKDVGDLDELKHHSQTYDYQTCPYPIHIFRELEIIDKELRRIRSQLVQNAMEKAIIVADHGASRLAVIYQHESASQIQLEEKGKHSGRCCPVEEDPEISAATYEDGFAVLCNYERFKGGRKANLEVHGGASLEEVIVPIITISLRPENIVYYFVDSVIKYKIGQTSEIVLFSNAPMQQPRLLVDGIFYDGQFRKDRNHALFSMPDVKKTREYTAVVYEGNANTGVELTFRVERNTKKIDLFG